MINDDDDMKTPPSIMLSTNMASVVPKLNLKPIISSVKESESLSSQAMSPRT